jgi:hypothetical protein
LRQHCPAEKRSVPPPQVPLHQSKQSEDDDEEERKLKEARHRVQVKRKNEKGKISNEQRRHARSFLLLPFEFLLERSQYAFRLE